MNGDDDFTRADGLAGSAWQADPIGAAQAGVEAAFVWLYKDNQPRLLRYAALLVGQDAEDVAAEAWSQIIRDLPKFSGDTLQFRAWAATILRNRALDAVRARRKHPIQAIEVNELADRSLDLDAATVAVDNISTAAAIALIASLPRDQAEAILLRAIVGLDANTAAKVLGKKPGAVRAAAHRGLRSLQKRLNAVDHGQGATTDA